MKNNEELQRDVQAAIQWEPLLNAAEIGVTVKDGVVTLTGTVDSYAKKVEAENAAKNVNGVRAVAESIQVNYGNDFKTSDTEIATAILNAWKWNWEVPDKKIKVRVENGWVTLEGELHWNYQKSEAKKSIERISGVKGVSNSIVIKSESKDTIEKKAVELALGRSWSIDTNNIMVEVENNNVKLTGSVFSLYQKEEAGRLAWNAPGVWSVSNELLVDL